MVNGFKNSEYSGKKHVKNCEKRFFSEDDLMIENNY